MALTLNCEERMLKKRKHKRKADKLQESHSIMKYWDENQNVRATSKKITYAEVFFNVIDLAVKPSSNHCTTACYEK